MEPQPRVLLVEDDERVRRVIEYTLAPQGFDVHSVDKGDAAVPTLRAHRFDVVILDRKLPDVEGLDVLARIRAESDVPVVILSGRASEQERIEGLVGGADDYVTKPFSPLELAARVQALVRRQRGKLGAAPLRFGAWIVNPATREVLVDGALVETTAREFELLAFLARHPRRTFTRDELLREVWDSSPAYQDPSTVTEHVRRLRLKLETDPTKPRHLVTVRGVGYRFEP